MSVLPKAISLDDQPLLTIKGIGPKTAKCFTNQKGIESVADLLLYLPKSYEDRRVVTPIDQLGEDTIAVVEGTVRSSSIWRSRRGSVLRLFIEDKTGSIQATWFGMVPRGFRQTYTKGCRVRLAGRLTCYNSRLQFAHPEIERLSVGDGEDDLDGETGAAARLSGNGLLLPIYPTIDGIGAKRLREMIRAANVEYGAQISDPVPAAVLKKAGLPLLGECLPAIHCPNQNDTLEAAECRLDQAQKRLLFDRLLITQLALANQRAKRKQQQAVAIVNDDAHKRFIANLPFSLTRSQQVVLNTILADLSQKTPMNRLLQGDVGVGKTIVMLAAAAVVSDAGYQVAIMVPTEILAAQHFRSAAEALCGQRTRIALLTSGMTAQRRRQVLMAIETGAVGLVVGTHSLIQETVVFSKLALVVIDEQQRFGVRQRLNLRQKGQARTRTHTLVATATPIPRTLAMSIYGDLDISVIEKPPAGRAAVDTKFYSFRQRKTVYARLTQELKNSGRAYIVFPLAGESDKLALRDAQTAYETLSKQLASYSVALLTGQMPSEEKEHTMDRFRRGEVQVLVATTVIEIGMDVPEATVMLIEHAERFGLSQLHQLRGRVGRGSQASHCWLIGSQTLSADAKQRIKAITSSTDGFAIAQADLEIRGSGDIWGTSQAGFSAQSIAQIIRDPFLVECARDAARDLFEQDSGATRSDLGRKADALTRRAVVYHETA